VEVAPVLGFELVELVQTVTGGSFLLVDEDGTKADDVGGVIVVLYELPNLTPDKLILFQVEVQPRFVQELEIP